MRGGEGKGREKEKGEKKEKEKERRKTKRRRKERRENKSQKVFGGGGFPGGAVVRNPPANAGDTGSCPGPGRSHMPHSG